MSQLHRLQGPRLGSSTGSTHSSLASISTSASPSKTAAGLRPHIHVLYRGHRTSTKGHRPYKLLHRDFSKTTRNICLSRRKGAEVAVPQPVKGTPETHRTPQITSLWLLRGDSRHRAECGGESEEKSSWGCAKLERQQWEKNRDVGMEAQATLLFRDKRKLTLGQRYFEQVLSD